MLEKCVFSKVKLKVTTMLHDMLLLGVRVSTVCPSIQ